MKATLLAATFALALTPALLLNAQHVPGRLANATYESGHGHSALANCQCENRKGYDLWCQPVSFLDYFRSSNSNCCGHRPAPTCCAPEPTCAPPAPTCCAPEPTCQAPEPVCAAPAPTCCAPEPSCCAPEPSCGAPAGCGCMPKCKTGLFNQIGNPLSGLHAKMKSLFSCNKCSKSSCCCDSCSTAPSYYQPSSPGEPQELPDSIDNPFRDDPAISIPVPGTTTRANPRSLVKPVYYRQ